MAWTDARWTLVLDHDEVPTVEMAKSLRQIVSESNKGIKYQAVRFSSQVVLDGVPLTPTPDKLVFHLNMKELYIGLLHPIFERGAFARLIERPEMYLHYKTSEDVVENASRNCFLGGGGADMRNASGLWEPLRSWCKEHDIITWNQFKSYLKQGNIDQWLKTWIEAAWNLQWHDMEYKGFKLWYYGYLHPEEASNFNKNKYKYEFVSNNGSGHINLVEV